MTDLMAQEEVRGQVCSDSVSANNYWTCEFCKCYSEGEACEYCGKLRSDEIARLPCGMAIGVK